MGGLWADLREFDRADDAYRRALGEYRDVSPFAVAWACFQLGMLWGEVVPEPQPARAAQWYRKAIDYLPGYVKARVHLAEILASQGRQVEARDLLVPALASGDPEVDWRLADISCALGRMAETTRQPQTAREGFERLLERHPLAFADHAAEFYAGSGADPARAFELAKVDLDNRPTLRAFEQAHAAALEAGELLAASEIRGACDKRWGATPGFRFSPLASASAPTEIAHAG